MLAVQAEVGVKHHAHRAHQQASGGQYLDALIAETDQAVVVHRLQGRPLILEVAAKIDGEGLLDGVEIQFEMADQLLNHCATQAVVCAADQATAGSQLGAGQGVLVVVQVAGVLAVQVADLADGRDTEAYQIAMAVGGVTLEVAL